MVADGGDDAIAVIRRFDGVDDDTADRLADLKRSGDLDTSDLNRLENALDNGEIDGRDLRRASELLSNEEGYRGENVEADDILRVSEQRGDISEIIAVTKDTDGNVVWLEEGRLTSETRQSGEWIKDNGGSGWRHIAHNRLSNPNGNQFLQYGDEYTDIEAVKRLVFTALDDGDRVRVDGDIFYQYREPDSGRYISVLVGENGYAVTVKPTKVTG
ncbi:hypothetical protein BRC96_04240 [Halobacteriales archaeon QS_6_64_34]|nr:MAG: hypothetical protein BRC96_04240 [Halobacteriales archaeon QS_6_64_34]